MRFTAKFPGGEWVKTHLQENKISKLPKLDLLNSTVSCEGVCSSLSQFCMNNVRNEKKKHKNNILHFSFTSQIDVISIYLFICFCLTFVDGAREFKWRGQQPAEPVRHRSLIFSYHLLCSPFGEVHNRLN